MLMENITMQQLKEQRLTPAEKFVLDTIKGVKPDKPDEYGYIRWRDEDGRCLIRQEFINKRLWVGYAHFGYHLEGEYGLNYDETKQLLTKLLYKYTNNGQLKINGSSRWTTAII
jgi:hypothetical protein